MRSPAVFVYLGYGQHTWVLDQTLIAILLEVFLSEYERWEARFAVPEYAFGKDPNYFIQSCKGLLPPSGRALAVADGEGRNGVWLAEHGLDVLSLDFSPSEQKKVGLWRPSGTSMSPSRTPTCIRGTILRLLSM